MKKFFLIMALLLSVGATARAQKFAFIDMEYILQHIPAYQSAGEELDRLSQQRQTEVENVLKEVKALFEEYQNKQQSLSETQRAQKEEEIVTKEKKAAELRRTYFGPEGELEQKRNELMQPIQDAVYEAVKTIATRQGYAAVIDRASAESVIFASPDIDISNEVLARLGYSN